MPPGFSGGATTLSSNSVALPGSYGSTLKWACAVGVNELRSAVLGALTTPDLSGAFPVGLTTLRFGRSASTGSFLNGYLRRLAYWPAKLTDTQLQAITAP